MKFLLFLFPEEAGIFIFAIIDTYLYKDIYHGKNR